MTDEFLVQSQLATMLISAGHNFVGPGHRQMLSPVIDELVADVADALGRRPEFGGLLQVWLTPPTPDVLGREGCPHAQEVPRGVQA